MITAKSTPTRRLVLALAACAALPLALTACSSGGPPAWAAKLGSGVSVTSPQSVSAGNDSPGAAVYGYITTLVGSHPAAACGYVEPSVQSQCNSGLAQITPSQVPLSEKNPAVGWVAISGTKALVGTTGTYCDKNSSPQCFTNTDPAAILDSGKSFNDLWNQSVAASSNTGNVYELAPCVQVSGKWYVYQPASS
jgi:hypothetical protein